MKRALATGGILVMTAGSVLAGCGGGGEKADTPADRPAATTATPASGTIPEPMKAFVDNGDVAEVTIEGDDLIRFSLNRFEVKPGQMVRVTLRHTGSLPAQAMGHNVVILKAGNVYYEFGADVGENGGSAANNFVPEPLRDRVIAFTRMIGGGESAIVEFKAPEEPGEYPFLCTFPGHFGQMNGNMVVK